MDLVLDCKQGRKRLGIWIVLSKRTRKLIASAASNFKHKAVWEHRIQLLFWMLCKRKIWKKMKTESVSSLDGKVSIYKRQRKSTLMCMNSSILTTPTSHPRKHITCNIALTHNQPVTVTTMTTRQRHFPSSSVPLVAPVTSITFSCDLQPNLNYPSTYFSCHWLFQPQEPAITISINHQTTTFTHHLWFPLTKSFSSWLPDITIDSFNYSKYLNHSFSRLEIYTWASAI